MKTPRSAWRDYRAKRSDTAALSKGEAQRKKERKKLLSAPGAIRKQIAERGKDLLSQITQLATSGALGPALLTAGVATAASVAAVSTGLVDSIADRLPWTEPKADQAAVEQLVEESQETAIGQAMAAADEARTAIEASATVEARLTDVDDRFDGLRDELFAELETFQGNLSTLGGQVDVLTARLDDPEPEARLRAVETLAAAALETAEAIEIPDTTGIAANTEALALVQNELALARAVINDVPSLRAAVESAEGLAVLARAEAGIAGDSLDAVRAEVAAQEAALGEADEDTVVALAQAEEAFLLAQQNEARAAQAIEQTAALESEIGALTVEVAASEATLAAVQATADAAATQQDLAALAAQADAAQMTADQAAVDLAAAQAAVTALGTDQAATEADLAQAQADVAAAQTAADMAQLTANGARLTADGAEAAAQTAQAAADTAQTAADTAQATADTPTFPLTTGPGTNQTAPPNQWVLANSPPLTIQTDGLYEVTMVAEYASGSGNAFYQAVQLDGSLSDPSLSVRHGPYDLVSFRTYTATFVLQLTAGQTVDQLVLHNSAGNTGWTPILLSAERIGP